MTGDEKAETAASGNKNTEKDLFAFKNNGYGIKINTGKQQQNNLKIYIKQKINFNFPTLKVGNVFGCCRQLLDWGRGEGEWIQ